MNRDERLARYEQDYVQDYGYEERLVRARSRLTAAWLNELAPRRVVEVGCGRRPLFGQVSLDSLERWVVVEPAASFARAAAELAEGDSRLAVVRGFFELSRGRIHEELGGRADAVIIDSLLHEIPDPGPMLGAARELLADDGVLHVSVPNAHSLHRRLALAMKLVDDVHELGARNLQLAQARVYDPFSLRAAIEDAGFEVFETGGHTIKPFTNAQMQTLEETLGSALLDGLEGLAEQLPELAAEIHVRARPRPPTCLG